MFPLIYCLTTRKTSETYGFIFNHIKSHALSLGLNPSPSRVICDFELAAINSIQVVFSSTSIGGCLFHYSQAVWKKVIAEGLKQQYRTDEGIKNSVNYLLALPFIPLSNLFDVFDELFNVLHESVIPIWQYLELYYVRGREGRGRRRAVLPTFPPAIWNVYESTLNHHHRTNNHVEGWNSKFLKMIVTLHANIWKFLETVKKEQRDTEQLITQLEGGHTKIKYPIRKKYTENVRFVEEIVRNYEIYNNQGNLGFLTYLRAIAFRLKRPLVELNEFGDDDDENQ